MVFLFHESTPQSLRNSLILIGADRSGQGSGCIYYFVCAASGRWQLEPLVRNEADDELNGIIVP